MAKDRDHGDAMGLWRTLRVALGYWRPHWPTALVLLAMLGVQQGFKAFFAYSLGLVVKLLGAHDTRALGLLVAALAAGFVIAALATLAADYLGARVGAAIINTVRLRMFTHLQRLGMGFFGRTPSGDIVARFTSDLADIQKGLTTRVIDAFVACLGLLIGIPVAFYTEWRLAAAMVAGMPLIGLGTRLFGRQAAASRYALKQEEAGIAATVQENVRSQPVVKVFGLADLLVERFRAQIERVGRRWVRAELLAQLVGSASTLGVQAVQVLVLGFGIWLALRGQLAAGALVAFIGLQANISKDAYDLMKKVVPNLISSSGGLRRIEELLAEPVEVSSPPGSERLTRLEGPIVFEHVTFGYTGERNVLSDVSFTISAGESVAIVGGSGSGKTTILQLLMRFYDPQGGRITVGGRDLRTLDLASYHRQIAAVFQESLLLSGSVEENIRLSRPEATFAEVEAAARAAEIHDTVVRLPMGYATPLGELGGSLSGGQRQRLAIARAMLRDPALLILDEATSALDPATEAAVNATLARLSRGRIVVSVTHRLASARGASRILVMDEGRLVEQGTHDALVAARGTYWRLWAKQAGIAVEADGSRAMVAPSWLASVPLFGRLPESARSAIAARLHTETVGAGRTVVRQGEPGDRLYIIARGKVEVMAGVGSEARRLAVLSDGDFFGELALLEKGPRAATVRTLQPTVFATLTATDFDELLRTQPALREAVEGAQAARSAALPPAPSGTAAAPEARGGAAGPHPARPLAAVAGAAGPSALLIVRGPQAGARFPLRRPATRIGRSRDNDVVLAEPAVSSHHAMLVIQGAEVILTDLDSTNGTTHNGRAVTHPVPVACEDLIVIGGSLLKVV
ncbi:MAG TPA: ABC transporter transmembrane domain-containing protein [Thermoanaerobaculaceae bacterium]|nr:ABC transporter transmembrane domain-containing protein [Thermoanaerobaculaceae bacterium]HRS16471.1 ABC transporter transmembrane domain-containing protein [Thermoanaerobaculaceae bacterium]